MIESWQLLSVVAIIVSNLRVSELEVQVGSQFKPRQFQLKKNVVRDRGMPCILLSSPEDLRDSGCSGSWVEVVDSARPKMAHYKKKPSTVSQD